MSTIHSVSLDLVEPFCLEHSFLLLSIKIFLVPLGQAQVLFLSFPPASLALPPLSPPNPQGQ